MRTARGTDGTNAAPATPAPVVTIDPQADMPAAFRWGETELSKLLDASVDRQLVEQLQAAECDCAAYRVAFEGAVLEMAGLLADTENDLRERQVMISAQAIMVRMQQSLKRLDAAANERAQLLTAVK